MNKLEELEDRWDAWFDSLSRETQLLIALSPLFSIGFVLIVVALVFG